MSLPDGDIVSGYADNPGVADLLDEIFEIDAVDIKRVHNQANLHWRPLSPAAPIWRSLLPKGIHRQRMIRIVKLIQQLIPSSQAVNIHELRLQKAGDLKVVGSSGECGLRAGARVFLFEGNEVHQYITDRLAALENGTVSPESFAFEATALSSLALDERGPLNVLRKLEQVREALRSHTRTEFPIPVELVATLQCRQYRLFDSTLGERSDSPFTNWQSPWGLS